MKSVVLYFLHKSAIVRYHTKQKKIGIICYQIYFSDFYINVSYYTLFLLFKGFARVARAVVSEHDDGTLSRHRRELPEELDEEDKPKARSKVPPIVTIFWKGKYV